DPNNTTVFVGGLPACISEETLKSFFHHFGDITYCKIPPGKGCGFVQFVRRQDAELAIAKMNDFPIHGKSRIRLSWG
ncbi:RNA-binding domain-containing protein, partial [Rhodotorula sp. JG-1b]